MREGVSKVALRSSQTSSTASNQSDDPVGPSVPLVYVSRALTSGSNTGLSVAQQKVFICERIQ